MEIGSVKILGGVGYILLLVGSIASIVPYGGLIGFVGLILVAIAWLALGGILKDTLMKAFGVLSIITSVLAALSLIILLFTAISAPFAIMERGMGPMGEVPGGMGFMPEKIVGLIGGLIVFVILILVVGILGIITAILHIIVHFRAARLTKIGMFKWAGVTYIVGIILFVISIVILILSIGSMVPHLAGTLHPMEFIFTMFLPALIILLIGGIILIVAYILSAVSFFSLTKVETQKEVTQEVIQP